MIWIKLLLLFQNIVYSIGYIAECDYNFIKAFGADPGNDLSNN